MIFSLQVFISQSELDLLKVSDLFKIQSSKFLLFYKKSQKNNYIWKRKQTADWLCLVHGRTEILVQLKIAFFHPIMAKMQISRKNTF